MWPFRRTKNGNSSLEQESTKALFNALRPKPEPTPPQPQSKPVDPAIAHMLEKAGGRLLDVKTYTDEERAKYKIEAPTFCRYVLPTLAT